MMNAGLADTDCFGNIRIAKTEVPPLGNQVMRRFANSSCSIVIHAIVDYLLVGLDAIFLKYVFCPLPSTKVAVMADSLAGNQTNALTQAWWPLPGRPSANKVEAVLLKCHYWTILDFIKQAESVGDVHRKSKQIEELFNPPRVEIEYRRYHLSGCKDGIAVAVKY